MRELSLRNILGENFWSTIKPHYKRMRNFTHCVIYAILRLFTLQEGDNALLFLKKIISLIFPFSYDTLKFVYVKNKQQQHLPSMQIKKSVLKCINRLMCISKILKETWEP